MSEQGKQVTPEDHIRHLENYVPASPGAPAHEHDLASALQWALPILRAAGHTQTERRALANRLLIAVAPLHVRDNAAANDLLREAAAMLRAPPEGYAELFKRTKEAELELDRIYRLCDGRNGEPAIDAVQRRVDAERRIVDTLGRIRKMVGAESSESTERAIERHLELPPCRPSAMNPLAIRCPRCLAPPGVNHYARRADDAAPGEDPAFPTDGGVERDPLRLSPEAEQKVVSYIAGKVKEARERPRSSRLENDLVELLSTHAGETGESEGAVEVLKRLLAEIGVTRKTIVSIGRARARIRRAWLRQTKIAQNRRLPVRTREEAAIRATAFYEALGPKGPSVG